MPTRDVMRACFGRALELYARTGAHHMLAIAMLALTSIELAKPLAAGMA